LLRIGNGQTFAATRSRSVFPCWIATNSETAEMKIAVTETITSKCCRPFLRGTGWTSSTPASTGASLIVPPGRLDREMLTSISADANYWHSALAEPHSQAALPPFDVIELSSSKATPRPALREGGALPTNLVRSDSGGLFS
jgi:hypothetical protein